MRKQVINRDSEGNRWTLSPGWFSENFMHAVTDFGYLIDADETITVEEFANRIGMLDTVAATEISRGLHEEMDWADTPDGQAEAERSSKETV